ncbi:N-acyl homoserine lactonase family protein [Azospirillum sp. YIM B02556]|uniref:N-acyl homoserine lactonase family protein n=1 Tax=Azospirillum endophyticum TaxID=2800326 RepID=A0ABS1EZE8_9PROT|nr:N-acyl homoserine lactonase family protein [Azospirillum endophyticum]MBK1836543.1 N-acyl homoserine lactonase family protein [Azospirillum endophyticum]
MPNRSEPEPYEVYALRYAEIGDRTVHENFLRRDQHDGPMPLDFFIWIVRNEDRTILVDTGFGERTSRSRSRGLLHHPVEALRAVGVPAEEVRHIILTHLHYDHAGNLECFPNATLHVQDAEVAFATGRCMCHRLMRFPYEVEDVVEVVRCTYAGRTVFTDGDATLFDGVSVHLLPGHSRGLQAVSVRTKRGTIVLASDASHFYANYESGNPFPLVVDTEDMLESQRRLSELCDGPNHIIPGHDPLVRRRYPARLVNGIELIALHEEPDMAGGKANAS